MSMEEKRRGEMRCAIKMHRLRVRQEKYSLSLSLLAYSVCVDKGEMEKVESERKREGQDVYFHRM